MASLTIAELVALWQASTLTKRSAAQEHYVDICQILEQPNHVAVDQTGTFHTFEKGAKKPAAKMAGPTFGFGVTLPGNTKARTKT